MTMYSAMKWHKDSQDIDLEEKSDNDFFKLHLYKYKY